MASSFQRCAAWKIVRSRGAGGVMLVVGWLVVNQASIWGQRPDGSGERPDAVKKTEPTNAKSPPKVGGAVAPSIVPDVGAEAILRELGAGRFNGQFGGFGGFQGVPRFTFTFAPQTPLMSLLPPAPAVKLLRPSWLIHDLSQVPQIYFQKQLVLKPATPQSPGAHGGKSGGFQGNAKPPATEVEKRTEAEFAKALAEQKALRAAVERDIAHTLAKINHVNKQGTDHFVQALMENRPDLAGLPFVMGDACRMSKGVSRQFISEVSQVTLLNRALLPGSGFSGGMPAGGNFSGVIVSSPQPATINKPAPPPPTADELARAKVAAWMQILGLAPGGQGLELVKKLSGVQHDESTRALARLAVFSFEKDVRKAALSALTKRSSDVVTPILLKGLRYPWPAVGENAAQAITYLQRRDLAPELIDFLDEPDPRAPFVPEDHCLPVVREVVRLNHHHNCITCHAPATSDPDFAKSGFTTEFLVAPVSNPVPDNAPPATMLGGYGFGQQTSPDLFLRVDVTYLRQDFSLVQKAEDSDFGPQRYDFLVRTREVTPDEARAYAAWAKQQGLNYRSPNHQAAHAALRQLLGGNPQPTAAAWRNLVASRMQ